MGGCLLKPPPPQRRVFLSVWPLAVEVGVKLSGCHGLAHKESDDTNLRLASGHRITTALRYFEQQKYK
jgi:hypothetical protein